MAPWFRSKVQATFIALIIIMIGSILLLSRGCSILHRESLQCLTSGRGPQNKVEGFDSHMIKHPKQSLQGRIIRNLTEPISQRLAEIIDQSNTTALTNHESLTKRANQIQVKSENEKPVEQTNVLLSKQQRCQEVLSQPLQNQSIAKYRIQLLAAAPGSGSDWCLYIIRLFTGLKTTGVYLSNTKVNEYKLLPKVHFYYKTHYPYMGNMGRLEMYLDTHPERAILMIRNPLDAGFSDFIRIKIQMKKLGRKYSNLTTAFSNSSFVLQTNQNTLKIQNDLLRYLNTYFSKWKYHHEYWLTKYKGPLKVVLYKDLVEDLRLFEDVLKFFGYEPDSSEERKMRFDCALQNALDNKPTKRPSVKFIETSKETVRQLYRKQTDSAISFVERLYFTKDNTTLHIV